MKEQSEKDYENVEIRKKDGEKREKKDNQNGEIGSGCGTVGRAVASVTRGYGFESSLRLLLLNVYLLLKDENKEKRGQESTIFK